MQIPYSALEREHEDWITKAVRGVGRGDHHPWRSGAGRGVVGQDREGTWAQFERAGLDELRELGESRSAFVLRFTLTHPHAHVIIVGTTRIEHLRENVEAVMRGPLSEDVVRRGQEIGSTVSARRPCRRGDASIGTPSLYLSPTGGETLGRDSLNRRRAQ